jgi:hypothetical protein
MTIYFPVVTKSGLVAAQGLFEKVPVLIDLLLHELAKLDPFRKIYKLQFLH